MSATPAPLLCTYIKNADGIQVKCQVLQTFVYDYNSFLPKMLLRGITERLNPINRIVVPMSMKDLFTEAQS